MLNQLKTLEIIARALEPQLQQRKNIASQTHHYIDHFIDTLPDSPAYRRSNHERHVLPIENNGKPFSEILANLETELNSEGINTASGGHMGHIPGGGIWSSAIADMLAAATNRYAGLYYGSPGAVRIENQVIRWLANAVGYPQSAHGNISSGGSIANLIAIQTARDTFGINAGNVKKSVIYFTEHAHHCIQKAFNTTGLHEAIHRIIPVNNHYQIDTDILKQTLAADKANGLNPFLVIATAGTTNTGTIDPLDIVATICEEYKTWFHVDAAYGGFFILVDNLREKFKGIERSHSLVMDPHKGLFTPYGAGIVLVRNAKDLLNAYNQTAAYLQDTHGVDEISPAEVSPELSKHFRGLRIWMPLQLHGLAPFKATLEEKYVLAQYFHNAIKDLGFETGPTPDLSVALFRLPKTHSNSSNVRTEALLAALHTNGRIFLSSTTIKDQFWIRCAILSFRTHLSEIQQLLDIVKQLTTDIT